MEDKCRMISGNALEQDYSNATVFYLYLIPRGLRIILPVLKAIGRKLRVITYMAPFPESEVPVETYQVTSTKHPDAQWPLYLYDIDPDVVLSNESSVEENLLVEEKHGKSMSGDNNIEIESLGCKGLFNITLIISGTSLSVSHLVEI